MQKLLETTERTLTAKECLSQSWVQAKKGREFQGWLPKWTALGLSPREFEWPHSVAISSYTGAQGFSRWGGTGHSFITEAWILHCVASRAFSWPFLSQSRCREHVPCQWEHCTCIKQWWKSAVAGNPNLHYAIILYDGVKDGAVMKYRLLTVLLLPVFNQIFVIAISIEWECEASRGWGTGHTLMNGTTEYKPAWLEPKGA